MSIYLSREAQGLVEILGRYLSALEHYFVSLPFTSKVFMTLTLYIVTTLPTFLNIDSNECLILSKGESGANVLVGIQVPPIELNEFRYIANNLGYEYEIESDNIGFQLLMR